MPDETDLNFLLYRLPVFIPPPLVLSVLKSRNNDKAFLALTQLSFMLCFMHLNALKVLK